MYNTNQGPQIDTSSMVFNLLAINIFFFAVSNIVPGIFPDGSPYMYLGLHYPTSEYFQTYKG